ncbi:serine-rich adhesin for platelets [Polyergus mexicanus]|uniref:serine-rich adhesin for platelets n=1 Tax=Polyergus mexicanus TaxID=615972 RepID=UPI0038B5B3E4
MSIHVTVSGNPVNICRGRMVLSDLDQIKKNERDRRRRLRLEQVRQQSKEMSNRIMERTKKIKRGLEKDSRSELEQMHDRKIMDLQQKYEEDLEDIGQAHALAALQPDVNIIIEEEERKDRATALKRGKDAVERMKEIKQKDSVEAAYQERLRKVREVENARAAMIAKLPKSTSSEENKRTEINSSQEDTNEEIVHKMLTPKRKNKKVLLRKSPRRAKKSNSKEQKISSPKPGPSGLQKQSVVQSHKSPSKKKEDKVDHIEYIANDISDDQLPRRSVPIISSTQTEAEKVARYNPEDYTQNMSDNTSSISSSSSNSTSDDSSYFSEITEQITCNKTPKTSSTESKVQLYDHNMHQRNVYRRPSGIVERIDSGNEPNAIEAAQAIEDAENVKTYVSESRKLSAQRRGEDAILREKVQKDFQAFMQNLDHLAQEERRLKASQIQSTEESTQTRLHQRNRCQEEHQKKLNRAGKQIFGTDSASVQYPHLMERIITLPMQKKDNAVPYSIWQEPHLIDEETDVCHTQPDKDTEMSREEQILDMLKKVERQKRLLLQEFGASLPDDIFNISIKPVFEDKTQAKTSKAAKSLSPEIKVINMSNSNKCVRKYHKVRKPSKSPIKKIEIAVQAELDKTGPAENKSVQVELPQKDTYIPLSSRDAPARIPHPIEPKITIITPETDDSSNDSTSSEISGMVIEIDKKEVVVTPKRRKSSILISKRLSPRVYQKIRSTSVSSKATSPMKRFSRSQLGTRLTSPQKKTKCSDTQVDTASRRVDIHVSKSAFTDDTDPSQETKVSIDASAESSQTFSGVNDQEQTSGKPYRIRTQMKRWIRIKDTSDTSTSFASPPPVKPKSMFDALSNVTPILEMLDTPRPEELRRLRQEVSPVSTPETPSPRTMMMPSNIPHRDRISRMLRYNTNDSQTNDSTIISSIQNDQSTLTDPSDACQRKSTASEHLVTPIQQPSISPKVCICKNPECKLLHTKLDDIHDYALKNCPEILQKYEDLQNLCTERIASLTDLIEKVRNEQKGIDLSLISPSDETSLMQLPTSKPAREDAQAVQRLIESIEAIHAQLAKTLLESQKIIGSETIPRDEPSCETGIQAVTSTPRSKSIDTVKACIQKSEIVESKAKPKIISNERVNIQLNRFKMQQRPQAMSTTKTSDRNSWPPCTFSLHEEEVIEKLSKEILEQSKNMDKTSTASKEVDEIFMQHKMSSSKNISLKNNMSLEHEKNNSITKKVTSTQEITKEHDFIPILAGIPKIPRNHGIVTSISTRPKPPITLLNGPYRPELESSGHELSTIVEFDTTDTVNKSIKSPAKSKPSVHVAPLSVQQNQHSSEKSPTSSVKRSDETLLSAQKSPKTTTICKSPEKIKSTADGTAIKTEANRERMLEKCNKPLQCNTTTEEPTSQAKDKLGSSISTDFNNPHKDSKHKTTSTSLYSFSGLSGISEIMSSPSSDILKHASSPEEMEIALKKLGLGWAVTTLKKTREASALSSSSNSDVTPINTARRMISPTKKQHDPNGLPDISDVSSISIKEASKSTEQAVLLKGRTSTPKFQNSNSNSERSTTTNTSESIQDPSDNLTVPNVSLIKTKSDKQQKP